MKIVISLIFVMSVLMIIGCSYEELLVLEMDCDDTPDVEVTKHNGNSHYWTTDYHVLVGYKYYSCGEDRVGVRHNVYAEKIKKCVLSGCDVIQIVGNTYSNGPSCGEMNL